MRGTRSSLFMIVVVLVAIGVVMIYSTSAIYANERMGDSLYFLKRHILYLLVGLFMMLSAMVVKVQTLKKYSKAIMAFSIMLLSIVIIGSAPARRAKSFSSPKLADCLMLSSII